MTGIQTCARPNCIKERNIVVLDSIMNLFQPYFLLISTFYIICSYIYYFYPFYTNVLYAILPLEVWTLIAVAQYLFPMVILLKIRASLKSWFYMLFYPIFIYSWVPITIIGYFHRHDREWSHTAHTRGLSFNDVLNKQKAKMQPDQVILGKKRL